MKAFACRHDMNLVSKNIRLRFVEQADAEFILKLRLDSRYNRFLSSVKPDLQAQKSWIKDYKEEEKNGSQFYFIIERLDGIACGTVRIYDILPESFCWGSWILDENKTRYAALESAFLVYEFGFEVLKFEKSHFDVMKKNEKVISFHKRMGALQTGEDTDNIYFQITKDSVMEMKSKFEEKLL